MKSLEILDDIYIDLEDYLLYMEKDLQERIKNNESEASIIEVSDSIKITQVNMYDKLNKIKQDLEVLEILNKHLSIVEMSNNWIEIDLYEENHKEEFEKVKQWLEENENER